MQEDNIPVTRADLDSVETRLKADLDSVEIRLLERIEKSETTLLREFRKWAISFESRFRANQVLVDGFSERMVSLEERVTDLEQRE